jgi:hypothetical protein
MFIERPVALRLLRTTAMVSADGGATEDVGCARDGCLCSRLIPKSHISTLYLASPSPLIWLLAVPQEMMVWESMGRDGLGKILGLVTRVATLFGNHFP